MTETESTEPDRSITDTVLVADLAQRLSMTAQEIRNHAEMIQRRHPDRTIYPGPSRHILTAHAAELIADRVGAVRRSAFGTTVADLDGGALPTAVPFRAAMDVVTGTWTQFREVLLHQGPSYRPEPEPVPDLNSNQVEALRGIASLLIRLDMDRVDGDQTPSYENRTAGDRRIMAWAVDTAGVQFDPHDLWDYDLVSDADHVHRCFTHRHDGANTLGMIRRG